MLSNQLFILEFVVAAFAMFGILRAFSAAEASVFTSALVSVAAAPFVISSFFLAMITIWPHHPQAAGSGLAVVFLTALAFFAWSRHKTAPVPTADHWGWFFIVVAAAISLLLLATRLAFYADQPSGNSDTLQYLAQAADLLKHRSIYSYGGIEGTVDGALRGDAHGILWIAYLASAMSTANSSGSFALDLAARPAMQLTLISYLAAGGAVASMFGGKRAAALAVLLLLTVPHIAGSSIGGDRDAFRLTGLMLLMAALSCISLYGSLFRGAYGDFAAAALVGFWALQGHALSLVLVPAIVCAWVGYQFLSRRSASRSLLLASAVALGFAIGAFPVAKAVVSTGSPLGDNVAVTDVLRGTVYLKGVEARDNTRIGTGRDFASRMSATLSRDGGWPSSAAIVEVLAVLALGVATLVGRSRLGSIGPVRTLLAVWFLALTALLLDVLPLGSFELGAWSILNPRYAMQWHLLAALAATSGLYHAAIYAGQKLRPQYGRSWTQELPLVIVLAANAAYVANLLDKNWMLYPTPGYATLSGKLNPIIAKAPSGCRVLAEDPGVTFHAAGQIAQLYSKSLRSLHHAPTQQQALSVLDAERFCIVVLYTGAYIDVAGPDTPLARATNGPAFRMVDAAPWRVYVRDLSAVPSTH